jgi:two-component system chemotaxis sensor kinase CheA
MSNKSRHVSLRFATLRVIALTLLALIGLLVAFSQTLVKEGFQTVETKEALNNVERVRDAFAMQVESISVKISDWSIWDDAYAFMKDGNKGFEDSSLAIASLLGMKVDLFLWLLPDGTIRWGREFDLVNGKAEVPRSMVIDFIRKSASLYTFASTTDQKSGIIDIPGIGPTFIAIQPVVKSDGEGPIAGALIAGRAINAAMLDRLKKVTHLDMQLWSNSDSLANAPEETIRKSLKTPKDSHIAPLDDAIIAGYTNIFDLNGKPIAFVKLTMPRDIHAQGQRTIYSFLGVLAFAGLCFGCVVTWLLQKTVISRIVGLASSITEIRHRSDLSLRVSVSGQDEITDLARSTNEMLTSIEKAKSEIEFRNSEMRLILDNAEQGFINVSLDGKIGGDMSAVVDRWLGKATPDLELWTYIYGSNLEKCQYYKLWWTEITDGIMPFEVLAEQMPSRFIRNQDIFQIKLRAIYKGSQLSSILAVVSKITEQVKAEALEREQRETLRLFQAILADRNAVVDYFTDSRERVKNMVENPGLARAFQMRELHTLKGNSAQLGIETFSKVCHDLETRMMDDESVKLAKEDVNTFHDEWQKVENRFRPLMQDVDATQIEVGPEDLRTVMHLVNKQQPYRLISKILASWQLEPVYLRFQRLGKAAEEVAFRLGKDSVRVHIEDNGIRVDKFALKNFWSNMVHVVRNALDHGIESPQERQLLNKTAHGNLFVKADHSGDWLVLSVRDDGRGVDWDKIRQKAMAKGLPIATAADLVNALFSDGISTRDDVSEISGRGIGMAAVKSAITRLNGRIELDSVAGKGTTFRFHIPKDSVDFSTPADFEDVKVAV